MSRQAACVVREMRALWRGGREASSQWRSGGGLRRLLKRFLVMENLERAPGARGNAQGGGGERTGGKDLGGRYRQPAKQNLS